MSKRRMSFVTNSSSSSFICEVCGNVDSGMDASASDLGFAQCVNGHTFCEDHKLDAERNFKQELIDTIKQRIESLRTNSYYISKPELQQQRIQEYEQELVDIETLDTDEIEDILNDYTEGSVPAVCCPICALDTVRDADVLMYIAKKTKVATTEVEHEIQQQFGTLDELKKYLKED